MYDFKLLKPISTIFYVLGWCISVVSILFGGYFISSGGVVGFFPGAGIILGGIIVGLFFLLISGLINLLLQIEKNTRK